MARLRGLNGVLGGSIGVIALIAVISGVTVFGAFSQLSLAVQSRARSDAILLRLDAFRAAMLNQETGVRGYILTGREGSLAPYVFGREDLDRAVVGLRRLIGRDSDQRRFLDQAETAAREWQRQIGDVVARPGVGVAARSAAAALESSGAGKARFDRFRDALAKIEKHERTILAREDERVGRAEKTAYIALIAGALVTVLICAAVGVAINRLVTEPLVKLADVMGRLVRRDTGVAVPSVGQRDEVGAMARAVAVFKNSLIELDRTELLRVTADTLPAMVGYIDTDRRVGFLNSEFERWFEGLDLGAVRGRALGEIFGAKPFPGAGDHLARALAGEEVRFEDDLALATGQRREVEGFFRPHRAPDDHVLGVVTLVTDLTERKDLDRRLARQARDLARSNEELEQFAYVASHDLKAPLRGIENLVGWIEEDLTADLTDETRANMELLKSRVRRLESLLDDLLAYSRAGRDERQSDRVDTRALVAELAELISPPAGFEIIAEDSLPTIVTPRSPLAQALQNLIGNAVKHHPNPATGRVTVSALPCGEMVEFTVADNGSGIPERYHARVFGMFQTLKPRDEVEGSGMGLAIVKKLVERQGGAVWLSAAAHEGGLAVHFTWPSHTEESTHGPPG